jgi:hypothetical protein
MSAALPLHGVCEHDYMRVNGDPKFYKMLASNSGGNERLIFSIVGVKVNRKGKSQERALVITNRAIYNTIPGDIRKCQRRIPLEKLHHLTVSNSCDNFVRAPCSHIPQTKQQCPLFAQCHPQKNQTKLQHKNIKAKSTRPNLATLPAV